jgi:hypothetical protein
MRAFISYSHHDRKRGSEVKDILNAVEIEAFLAHNDIDVSQEWRSRILHELKECKIFIPLLSQAFKSSEWAPQEVGIAASRPRVLIIPISLDGTNPFGFIAHLQKKPLLTTSVVFLSGM